MLLELAVWKSKIKDQFGMCNDHLTTEMKMQCQIDSISMVMFISFLERLCFRYYENSSVEKCQNIERVPKYVRMYSVPATPKWRETQKLCAMKLSGTQVGSHPGYVHVGY